MRTLFHKLFGQWMLAVLIRKVVTEADPVANGPDNQTDQNKMHDRIGNQFDQIESKPEKGIKINKQKRQNRCVCVGQSNVVGALIESKQRFNGWTIVILINQALEGRGVGEGDKKTAIVFKCMNTKNSSFK